MAVKLQKIFVTPIKKEIVLVMFNCYASNTLSELTPQRLNQHADGKALTFARKALTIFRKALTIFQKALTIFAKAQTADKQALSNKAKTSAQRFLRRAKDVARLLGWNCRPTPPQLGRICRSTPPLLGRICKSGGAGGGAERRNAQVENFQIYFSENFKRRALSQNCC